MHSFHLGEADDIKRYRSKRDNLYQSYKLFQKVSEPSVYL